MSVSVLCVLFRGSIASLMSLHSYTVPLRDTCVSRTSLDCESLEENLSSTISTVYNTLTMLVNLEDRRGCTKGHLGNSCPPSEGEDREEQEGRWLRGLQLEADVSLHRSEEAKGFEAWGYLEVGSEPLLFGDRLFCLQHSQGCLLSSVVLRQECFCYRYQNSFVYT